MTNGPIPESATIGEGLLRLGVAPGERLEDAPHLSLAVGGAEANVAVAVARMGKHAAWCSRLPTSALGRIMAGELARQGVDVSQVMWVPDGPVAPLQ